MTPAARFRLLFLATAAMAVQACGGDVTPNRASGGTRTDSAGIEIVTTRIDASAPTCALQGEPVRIGAVEGDEATSLFGVEDAVRLSDGRIAVSVDGGDPAIAVFDAAGSPSARWGRRGDGPGEFKDTWRIWTDADTLIVLDLRPVRFHYFDVRGAWVRTVQLDPVVFERPDFIFPLPGGRGFVSESQATARRDPPDPFDEVPTVVRFGADGALVDTLGTFWKQRTVWTDPEAGYLNRPIFGALATMVPADEGRLAYGPGREPQVELLDVDGTVRRIIRWEARDRTVRPADVEAFKADLRRRFEANGSGPRIEAAIRRETGDHRPVAGRFPGHGTILSPLDGRLWVQDYRRPRDEGPTSWFVFEPRGTFVCRVAVPEGWIPLSVGSDHLVARFPDDLGVEYVFVQSIRAAEPGAP